MLSRTLAVRGHRADWSRARCGPRPGPAASAADHVPTLVRVGGPPDDPVRTRRCALLGDAQHAVGGVRPAFAERGRVYGGVRGGCEQRGHVVGVGSGFGGGKKAGAHSSCSSASVQGLGQRGAGGDAPGGDHGHLDRRDDLPEQRGQWRRAPHMATGLDPLGDHRVAAGVDGGHGLLDRADLPKGDRAAGMDALHHGGVRITPEHIDDACATGR
jgi:hypothetical protein